MSWRYVIDMLGKIETFYWLMLRRKIVRRKMVRRLTVTGWTVMNRGETSLMSINGKIRLVIVAHILFDYNLLQSQSSAIVMLTHLY